MRRGRGRALGDRGREDVPMNTLRLLALSVVAVTFTLIEPLPAEACGGLFCSSANPVPVEQNAERVLFVRNENGTYTTYVEIQYTGDPRAFSWVVPVPGTPELGV